MKETIEERVKRIMSSPVDKNEKYVFKYYLDNREPDKPALYVLLKGGAFMVTQGRHGLGWRGGKIMQEVFYKLQMEHEIYDDKLLTEAEACETAESMGLNIDVPKKEMIASFTQYNGYEPNIVDDDIEALLARREEAREEVKKRGW